MASNRVEEPYIMFQQRGIMEKSSMKLLGVNFHWTLNHVQTSQKCWNVVHEAVPSARWITNFIGKAAA